MLNYIYTLIQFIPVFIMSAFSDTFKYPHADKIVEDELKELESRAVENKEIINHTINVDDIRAKGF